ncbi:L-dopachrome tautomerase-related protein [Cognatishimia sp. SS12]|uniref:SMP-30/gluconolactonase/LRE family protein n=1 Tax=Cognatishimia sp. SS12 TaxID=2979465 RepID=UPI00232A8899|nr:L-dopachrome tautomerase-related protein [Cognatishimia sp. SS12]MDC0739352.1 L-dopachrome tautomerase-related protein [Cognatishimia sp. SS12]
MFKSLVTTALLATGLSSQAFAEIETYATFTADMPPGNLAIAPDGRMFMSVHEFYGKALRIVEVMPDGSTKPYPNAAWSNAPEGDGPGLKGVLGLRADREGILWMLDGQAEGQTGRIVGWNTNTETLHAIFYLGQPATLPSSFLNDLAVDREHNAIYITDTANAETTALIVLDMDTGRARRVLEASAFTVPEDTDMVIDGKVVHLGGAPAKIGANPITIDPTNEWVYFAPMTASAMYRVRTTDLLDDSLSEAELAARVQRYGDKPISDGSTVDADGNVYITSITEDAVGVTKADGTYEILYQADNMSWPDGFAMGPDGYVYVTINELHRSPVLNGGEDATQGEFSIMRFPALGGAVSGR